MGVPHAVVISCSDESLAKPKSAIFRTASSSLVVHKMFYGFIKLKQYLDVPVDYAFAMAKIESISDCKDYLSYLTLILASV